MRAKGKGTYWLMWKALKVPEEQTNVWERRNTYATGDDRFLFPPLPGYTGKKSVARFLADGDELLSD